MEVLYPLESKMRALFVVGLLTIGTANPIWASEVFIPQIGASTVASFRAAVSAAQVAAPVRMVAPPAKSQELVPANANYSSITQIGSNNFAAVAQVGGNNLSAVVQQGSGNQAIVSQRR